MPAPSKWKSILLNVLLTVLCITCFPANPLVLTGLLKVDSYTAPFISGCVVWVFGMVLVMAPMVMFPRRGGVPKKKSYVHTTALVTSGIYAVIRHPQYTGGVYSIFLTTFLWYPHWLFAVLGVLGIAVVYISCREEDRNLISKFGSDYTEYMKKVPGMNIFLGVLRLIKRKDGL
ncbi:MAG: isoprenylcysteine carboxylmethyltransferase family protein [Spirochaetales bacterium]|nr:isoprenylcysteine carboxylmethyltransferase family protein [Spirochaetales bacterium]